MYYTVIKHDEHLRTRVKCRQHQSQASVFYISRVFSNVRGILLRCNTRLRLLHLLYDIEVMWRKTIKHAFFMFYTLIKHGFLTNQSVRTILSILHIYIYIYIYIYNCRQYCFGLLGLISAVLMSAMEVKLKKPPRVSHTCGISAMPECSN